ncbi:MAG: ferritin family protein [Chloroflexi bacterium]|nr:ferritin family protein [Chloroflexota bacterium]
MKTMLDELTELIDAAMYKEITANAFYTAAQSRTEDAGARAMLQELAEEELGHLQKLKALKEKGFDRQDFHLEPVPNLRLSEYLASGDSLVGAGLNETLTFAIMREQQAIAFYAGFISILRDEAAKHLAEWLAQQELRHKLRLEILYDDLFYKEH